MGQPEPARQSLLMRVRQRAAHTCCDMPHGLFISMNGQTAFPVIYLLITMATTFWNRDMTRKALNVIGRLARQALDSELPEEDRLDAVRSMMSWRVHRAKQLLGKLQPSPARDAVAALCDRITAGDEQFQQVTGRVLSGEGKEAGQGPSGSKRCGVLLVSPGAHRIIFVFNGNAGRFHIVPAYANRTDCHVMFVRDPSRCFCLCAIPGFGDDYEQNLAIFRQAAAGLGATEIYCVGYSAGGYAALRYGLDLAARGVLSIAGPSTLDISEDPNLTIKDYPPLRALYQQARHLAVDLVPLYAKAANPPKVLAVYGEGHKRDAMLANRMRSLPTVTLEALPDFEGHNVGGELTQQGKLYSYIERIIPPLKQGMVAAEAAD